MLTRGGGSKSGVSMSASPCTICSRIVSRHSEARFCAGFIRFSIPGDRSRMPADAGHCGSGDGLRPASGVADSAARNRLGGYLSTTDAVCYHDGHRSLNAHRDPVYEVPIWGDDGALRDEHTIRVTDMAFDEDVLLDQDKFLTAVLARPEFQHSMTGTELRYRLGAIYAEQERAMRRSAGLLATCHRLAIPVFVGAPADGSVFLNSMKLWAMRESGLIDSYGFNLDLHAEVFEACAYHRWGLFDQEPHALAALILGGGVPKNYNLQPEPALGQVLGIPNVRGYNFDVQIVTAPVTDGSLTFMSAG